MKFHIAVITILLLSTTVSADKVSTESLNITADSYELITYDVIQNLSMIISGEVDKKIDILILENNNYQNWLNETDYKDIMSDNIDPVEFLYELEISSNNTVYVLFINTYDYTVKLTYTLEIVLSSSDRANYQFYFFVMLIPLVYRNLKFRQLI